MNHFQENGFPKSSRLLSRRDFTTISAKGQHFVGKSLLIQWRKTGSSQLERSQLERSSVRLGIIVTKKFGNAVERNRFKRLVRESFRLSHPKPNFGLDITVRPRKNIPSLMLSACAEDLMVFFSTLK